MSNQAGAFVSDGTKMVKATSFGQALALVIGESHYNYHDISNCVGAKRSDIKKWEDGDEFPTPVQMRKLFATFPKLKHLAATFKVPGASGEDATAEVEVAKTEATKDAGKKPAELAYVGGEMGDLEVASIEYGRAIRDHVRAVTLSAQMHKAAADADAEVKRLDDLVTSLFGKLQAQAGGA